MMQNGTEQAAAAFAAIERKISWPANLATLLQKVVPIIRHRSMAEKLNPEQYEKRLTLSANFFKHLATAFNPAEIQLDWDPDQSEQAANSLWHHQALGQIRDFDNRSAINKRQLQDCLSVYFSYPWLQCSPLDWILMDGLLFQEIIDERDGIAERCHLTKRTQHLLFAEDMDKAGGLSWMSKIALFAGLVIVPVILLALIYLSGKQHFLFIGAGVYFIVLVGFFSYLPVMLKENRKKIESLKDAAKGLQGLMKAYHYCTPPIINPTMVERYILQSVDHGIFVNSGLLSLVGSVKTANPNYLLAS